MDHTSQALASLVDVANETGNNKYEVVLFALGVIPFKNSVNMTVEVGHSFIGVARWLLNEIENNLNN